MADFQASVILPRPLDQTFLYLQNPTNFLKMVPAKAQKNVSLKLPEFLHPGSLLEFEFKALGSHHHIILEVTNVIPNERIVAIQRKGPFRQWVHEQRFEQAPESQTLLTNAVEFEPPGGLLGFIVTAGLVKSQLKDWVAQGHEMLKQSMLDPGDFRPTGHSSKAS